MDALDWRLIHNKWIYVLWMEPGQRRVTAVKELRGIEQFVTKNRLRGWIAESEKQFGPMHKILEKLGAKKYAEDNESFYFMKEIAHG